MKFIELDQAKGGEGNELDEFQAHKFLESLEETMTVLEMRQVLREVDQDANGQTALLEYLLFRYKFTVEECVNSPQGGNQEEVDAAQAKFDDLQAKLATQMELVATLDAASEELAVAVRDLDEAIKETEAAVAELTEAVAATQAAVAELEAAAAELQTAEDTLHAAETELEEAIAALDAESEAYHGAIATAEAKANDDSLGVVTRNRAAAELSQLKAEDPLPLRKAKITQEASLRKVGKEKKKVLKAKEETLAKQADMEETQRQQEAKQVEQEEKKANQEAKQAEQQAKQEEVEAAKAEAEAGQAELEAAMEVASAELEELAKKAGTPEGFLFFNSRAEFAADKYLPTNKRKWIHDGSVSFVDQYAQKRAA